MTYLAIVMVCAVAIAGPDCARDTALDIVMQPVAYPTECAKVGETIATHVPLPAGTYHKIACERRKG